MLPPNSGPTSCMDCLPYLPYLVFDVPQPVAIPSYIIAIASGNFIYRPFPPVCVPGAEPVKWKTGVWNEPEVMDAAYWEFEKDTARFVLGRSFGICLLDVDGG